MKFGVYLPNFGPFGSARVLAALAADAEAAGWDGFFIWDHMARSWVTAVVDPWVALAAIAVNTTRVRIGALVTPLPRRRPWKVARESVSIDHLSNGRLVFGVGTGSSGGSQAEWQSFGEEMHPKVRGAMLDEGLAVVAGLWSGETFSFSGAYYCVEPSRFLPVPVQSPRIPVWVAGYWPHRPPFRRAARWEGVFPLFEPERGDVAAQLAAAVRYARQQRDDASPFEVVHAGTTPGDDRERAADIVGALGRSGMTWWLERIDPRHFGADWQEPWPLETMRQRIAAGPPGHL